MRVLFLNHGQMNSWCNQFRWNTNRKEVNLVQYLVLTKLRTSWCQIRINNMWFSGQAFAYFFHSVLTHYSEVHGMLGTCGRFTVSKLKWDLQEHYYSCSSWSCPVLELLQRTVCDEQRWTWKHLFPVEQGCSLLWGREGLVSSSVWCFQPGHRKGFVIKPEHSLHSFYLPLQMSVFLKDREVVKVHLDLVGHDQRMRAFVMWGERNKLKLTPAIPRPKTSRWSLR